MKRDSILQEKANLVQTAAAAVQEEGHNFLLWLWSLKDKTCFSLPKRDWVTEKGNHGWRDTNTSKTTGQRTARDTVSRCVVTWQEMQGRMMCRIKEKLRRREKNNNKICVAREERQELLFLGLFSLLFFARVLVSTTDKIPFERKRDYSSYPRLTKEKRQRRDSRDSTTTTRVSEAQEISHYLHTLDWEVKRIEREEREIWCKSTVYPSNWRERRFLFLTRVSCCRNKRLEESVGFTESSFHSLSWCRKRRKPVIEERGVVTGREGRQERKRMQRQGKQRREKSPETPLFPSNRSIISLSLPGGSAKSSQPVQAVTKACQRRRHPCHSSSPRLLHSFVFAFRLSLFN